MNDEVRAVLRPLRRSSQRAQTVLGEPVLDAGQGEMRSKWPAIHLEPQRLECDLDVVVQELESRFLRHAHPYDASPPKVRERANSAQRQQRLTVARRDSGDRRLNRFEALLGLLVEKLEGQMQERLVDPRQLWSASREAASSPPRSPRRTAGGKLIARKRRTVSLRQFVERAGAETAWIELDPIVTGRFDGCLEASNASGRRSTVRARPRVSSTRARSPKCRTRRSPVDAELAQRGLGPLDALEATDRHRSAVRNSRRQAGRRRLLPGRQAERARAGANLRFREFEHRERRHDTVLSRGLRTGPVPA